MLTDPVEIAEYGPGRQKAREILTTLAQIFGASKMIAVTSAQIAGVSYGNIGEAGLSFLRDWAAMGDKACVPAFMNPAAVDRELWPLVGLPEKLVEKQLQIIECLERLGVEPTLTCTPYHTVLTPKMGDHLAWSESSAVIYANSVLGARTNREGGPSALAAALTGWTPYYGLHCDENRRASIRFVVECALETEADYAALGALIGRKAGTKIPWLDNVPQPAAEPLRTSCLKALGAAMAATGAIALFHIRDWTPEAKDCPSELTETIETVEVVRSLTEVKQQLTKGAGKIDLVSLGCPHLSYEELLVIKSAIGERKFTVPVWLTTAQATRARLSREGILAAFEQAGAIVLADTCVVVTHLKELGFKAVATNSGKAATYLPSHQGVTVRFGTLEQCLKAAVSGQWQA